MAPSPGVRISGGAWRGRALKVTPGVRPTESRVREALLSIWQARVPDARVLDLFAGSGAVGIEARSRGAASVLLVENDVRAWRALVAACRELEDGAGRALRVWRGTLPGALADLARQSGPFDLVFADPPYGWNDYPRLLAPLRPLLAPDAEVALEHSVRTPLDMAVPGFEHRGTRTYGDTMLTFLAADAQPAIEAAGTQRSDLENEMVTGSATDTTGTPSTSAGRNRQSRR